MHSDPCAGLPNEILTINSKGCKYFFYCRNGESIEGFCPNNMWFNFDAGICDRPENVYCTFDTKPTHANGHAQEDDENVSCPMTIDAPAVKFIPSKTDCGRYYICNHGQAIKQHCTDNLHWNVAANKCDQPSNARCQVNNNIRKKKNVRRVRSFAERNGIFSFILFLDVKRSDKATAIDLQWKHCTILAPPN